MAAAKIQVVMETSRHGNPEPVLLFSRYSVAGEPATFREVRSALYRLAAAAERYSPNDARWVVVVVAGDCCGTIKIELADCSDAEANAALTLLGKVAASF